MYCWWFDNWWFCRLYLLEFDVMYLNMFKVKIYCVMVIYVEFYYEGLIVIDSLLFEVLGICEYE